jgi:hypothetical protein
VKFVMAKVVAEWVSIRIFQFSMSISIPPLFHTNLSAEAYALGQFDRARRVI